jgi:hypothetical protein
MKKSKQRKSTKVNKIAKGMQAMIRILKGRLFTISTEIILQAKLSSNKRLHKQTK